MGAGPCLQLIRAHPRAAAGWLQSSEGLFAPEKAPPPLVAALRHFQTCGRGWLTAKSLSSRFDTDSTMVYNRSDASQIPSWCSSCFESSGPGTSLARPTRLRPPRPLGVSHIPSLHVPLSRSTQSLCKIPGRAIEPRLFADDPSAHRYRLVGRWPSLWTTRWIHGVIRGIYPR